MSKTPKRVPPVLDSTELHPNPRAGMESPSSALRTGNSLAYTPETLIAYEFLEPGTHLWRWELATVEQQVSVRTMDVDMWLRKGEDGTYHTATDNIITSGRKGNNQEEEAEEDGLLKTLSRTKALMPLADPTTEEGREIKKQLDLKEHDIEERTKTAKENLARLRKNKERLAEEQTLTEQNRLKAMKEFESAKVGVEGISPKHLYEIQSYRTPPAIVKLVISAVMVILGEKCYNWQDMANVIKGGDFLSRVIHFSPSEITEAQCRELRSSKFLKNPRFTYEEAVKGSYAVGQLYQWILSQLAMMDVAVKAKSFEKEMAQQQRERDAAQEHLQKEQETLQKLEKEMQDLALQYQKAERREKAAVAAAQFEEQYVTPTKTRSRSVSFTSLSKPHANPNTNTASPGLEDTEIDYDALTGGQDLHKVWYRPESMEQTRYGTILLSSVLCDLGPSPPVGSSLVLEPWQKTRIEEAIRARAAEQSETPSARQRGRSASFGRGIKTGQRVITQHFKMFEGDEWGMVLEDSPEELRLALTNDVAVIVEIPNRSIKQVSFRCGSLHVELVIEHDSALSKEDIQASIEDGDYPEVMALYRNRHERRDEIEKSAREKGTQEKQLKDLQEAKRQALEAEQQAVEEAMMARSALEKQKNEIAMQLAVAQTSSQAEALEEIQEQLAFREAFNDANGLQQALEDKDKQLEAAERDLSMAEARLKDQELRMTKTQLLLKEKDTALQQALENLQKIHNTNSSPERRQESSQKVVSHHKKVLDGDEWEMVLEDSPEELRLAFTADVANACQVPNRSVSNLQLTLGSLHAEFDVEHDDTLAEDEVQKLVDEGDYSTVLDVYTRRKGKRQSLEAQAEERRRLEEELEKVRQEKEKVEEEKKKREEEMAMARREAEELRKQTELLEEMKEKNKHSESQKEELAQLRRQLQEKEEEKKALLEQQQESLEKVQALRDQVEEKEKALSTAQSKSAVATAATSNEVEKVWKTANKQLEGQREAHMVERRRLEQEKKELAKEKKRLEKEIEVLQQQQQPQSTASSERVRESQDSERLSRELEEARRELEEEKRRRKEEEEEHAKAELGRQRELELTESTKKSSPVPQKVVSHHKKVLDGDEWEMVLEDSPEELRLAFTADVANACQVPNRSVSNLQLTLGSLHAEFDVEHDDTLAEDEVQKLVDEGDYSTVLDVYTRRKGKRQSLEAQAEERRRLEKELEAQQREKEAMEKKLKETEKQMQEELRQEKLKHQKELAEEKSAQRAEEKKKREEEKKKKNEEAVREKQQKALQEAQAAEAQATEAAQTYVEQQTAAMEAQRKEDDEKKKALQGKVNQLVAKANALTGEETHEEREKIVKELQQLLKEQQQREQEAEKREKDMQRGLKNVEKKLQEAQQRLQSAQAAVEGNAHRQEDEKKEKKTDPKLRALQDQLRAIQEENKKLVESTKQDGKRIQSEFGLGEEGEAKSSSSSHLLRELYLEAASHNMEKPFMYVSVVGVLVSALISLQYKKFSYLP